MSFFVLGWRQLVSDRRRFTTAAIALVFGVALLLGTLIGVQSVNSQLTAATTAIRGLGQLSVTSTTAEGSLTDQDLRTVAELPGVARVIPLRTFDTTVRLPDGTEEQQNVTGVAFDSGSLGIEQFVAGRVPAGSADETLVPSRWATTFGIQVGADLVVATASTPRTVRVVGVLDEQKAAVFTGNNIFLPLPLVQQLAGGGTSYTRLDVVLDGVSAQDWTTRYSAGLPARLSLLDPSQVGSTFRPLLEAIGGILTTCSLVALVLSVVLIATALTSAVRARQDTLSIMRCVGASARWIVGLVVVEAVLLGVACSVVGLGLGLLLAWALATLLVGVGQLGTPQFSVQAWQLLAGLGAGGLASLLASLVVARQVYRAPVIESLRGTSTRTRLRPAWVAGAVGVVGVGGGAALAPAGGAGALAGFLACLLGAGLLATWLVSVVVDRGPSVSWESWISAASLRSHRSGRLVAGVFGALVCLGTGLVLGVASIATAMDVQISRQFGADVQVAVSTPNASAIASILAGADGVAQVSPMSVGTLDAQFPDGSRSLSVRAIEPATYFEVADLPWSSGNAATARQAMQDTGGVVLPKSLATASGLGVGDTLTLTDNTDRRSVPVVGTYASLSTGTQLIVDARTAAALGITDSTEWNIKARAGSNPDTVAAAVTGALRSYPGVSVTTGTGMRELAAQQLVAYSGTAVGLVALVIVLSTVATSGLFAQRTLERAGEFAVLRTVGVRPAQVARLVLWDCVYSGLAAVVVGVPVGLVAATILRSYLAASLGAELPAPAGTPVLVSLVSLTTLAAITISALIPARRAAVLAPVAVLRAE